MKRQYILGVLFFGGVWGISEAVLGGALYASNVPYASVPLTVVGLAVLTIARSYFPQQGTATLVAACALLYKFLNSPFFGCHLLGILITGACYDLVFDVLKIKVKSLAAATVTYLSYAAFALTITYLFRYDHWVQGGLAKVLGHVFIGGSMAAVACACIVPRSARLGEKLVSLRAQRSNLSCGELGLPRRFASRNDMARTGWFRLSIPGGIWAVTLGLWAFAVAMCLLSYPSIR